MTEREKNMVAWMMADQLVFAMDKYSGSEEQFAISYQNLQTLTDRFDNPDEIILNSAKTPDEITLLSAAYSCGLDAAFENSAQIAASVREAILPMLEKEVEDFFLKGTGLPEAPLS